MATLNTKKERRTRRHQRIRSRVSGTSTRPRLSLFKSNTRIVAQLIDDENQVTLASAATADSKKKVMKERIEDAAKHLVEAAKAKGVSTVVFDRGGFTYAGNIKLFADAARSGGLIF